MMILRKYRTRNNTKHWNIFEEEYIMNSNSCLLIQSLKIGRSKSAIQNRLIRLNKLNRKSIMKANKTIGLHHENRD
jgi:hypothetical protein